MAPDDIAVYPRAGGTAVKTWARRPGEFDWTPLRWAPGNQAIGFVEKQEGTGNLWLQPVDGGQRRQLTHFQGGSVVDFDWSADGRLAVEFSTVVREIFLVRERK